MIAEIKKLAERAASEVKLATDVRALDELRVAYLGKKGALTQLLKGLGSLDAESRPKAGQAANDAKTAIEGALAEALTRLQSASWETVRAQRAVDVTLPGRPPREGHLHPLTLTLQKMLTIFGRMGFRVETGPEVETDFNNFEALGLPPDHPARDMQDTFYVGDSRLLRTHTSPVQIRTMLARKAPPIRILAPGAVYRRDADVTHSPMFHQIEGLMVEPGTTFADLKGILGLFAREMFGKDTRTRFRPSYFPFTEPSAEVDISCFQCAGAGCRLCKSSGWIEVLGCGMVDPVVFEAVGFPADTPGFAFGIGIERIAMLKYQIPDIRLFYESDVRFLRQF